MKKKNQSRAIKSNFTGVVTEPDEDGDTHYWNTHNLWLVVKVMLKRQIKNKA